MSQVKLIVRDREVEICGTMHGSEADRVVAALSADPQAIAELEHAYIRFLRSDEWQPGTCPHSEPRLTRLLSSCCDNERLSQKSWVQFIAGEQKWANQLST